MLTSSAGRGRVDHLRWCRVSGAQAGGGRTSLGWGQNRDIGDWALVPGLSINKLQEAEKPSRETWAHQCLRDLPVSGGPGQPLPSFSAGHCSPALRTVGLVPPPQTKSCTCSTGQVNKMGQKSHFLKAVPQSLYKHRRLLLKVHLVSYCHISWTMLDSTYPVLWKKNTTDRSKHVHR